MTIEIGDKVRLTTETVMMLAKAQPDMFNKLLASGQVEGKVVDIIENKIMVDIASISPHPLEIEVAAGDPYRVLYVIEKAVNKSQPAMPDPPRQPPILDMMDNFDLDDSLDTPIEISKWIILQFLQLKQHGISQDLMRTPDYMSRPPEPHDQQSWESDGVSYRPVKVELSADEDQLYNTALRHLKLWLARRTAAPQHPECNSAPKT